MEYRKSVYTGGIEDTLETIREDAGETASVLVIGHNPTIAQLTSLLSEGDGSRQAHEALADGFGTSGVAVLRYAGDWADLDEASASVVAFHVGRG